MLGRPGSGVDIFAGLHPGVDIFGFTPRFRPVNLRLTPDAGTSHLLFICKPDKLLLTKFVITSHFLNFWKGGAVKWD